MKIIATDCNIEAANDTSLPYTAYLVEYKSEGYTKYDIVMSNKQSEIFDHYYDKYKNVKSIQYGSGTISPNRFGLKPPPKKKGKTVRGK